jgi:hypothetical protein
MVTVLVAGSNTESKIYGCGGTEEAYAAGDAGEIARHWC